MTSQPTFNVSQTNERSALLGQNRRSVGDNGESDWAHYRGVKDEFSALRADTVTRYKLKAEVGTQRGAVYAKKPIFAVVDLRTR